MANAQNPAWGPQSKVVTDSIYSTVLKTHRAYTIYLPQSYDKEADRKYPILYLLHGMSGVNTSWFTDQRVKDVMDQLTASGEACEMIIVSPNAGGNPATCWNGYFNMPGWAYEDFFYKEFMPYIEKTYRVVGDRQHRAVAGLSMGGGGTTSYAQRYPDLYCAAYAMSALMNIPVSGEAAGKDPDPTNKMAVLTRSVQEHSCIKYVLELMRPVKLLCAPCSGLWIAVTMISCSTVTSSSSRRCAMPAFLASSACATEGTPVNTGIRHCICVCLL